MNEREICGDLVEGRWLEEEVGGNLLGRVRGFVQVIIRYSRSG